MVSGTTAMEHNLLEVVKCTCIARVHPGALGVHPRVLKELLSVWRSESENDGGGAGEAWTFFLSTCTISPLLTPQS